MNPSLKWRTSKTFSIDDYDVEEGIDYHTLSLRNRSLDLDTIVDSDRVVTGIRFRVIDSHIRLEVRATKFDFQTGKLIDIHHSEWISNDSRYKKMLQFQRPDRPTRTRQKSIPIRGDNHYIRFQPSDIYKDAAQSTSENLNFFFFHKYSVKFVIPLYSSIHRCNTCRITHTIGWCWTLFENTVWIRRFHCAKTHCVRQFLVYDTNK